MAEEPDDTAPIEGILLPDGKPLPKGLKNAHAGYSFFREEERHRANARYDYLYNRDVYDRDLWKFLQNWTTP